MSNSNYGREGEADYITHIAQTLNFQPLEDSRAEIWSLTEGRMMVMIANKSDHSNCLVIYNPYS